MLSFLPSLTELDPMHGGIAKHQKKSWRISARRRTWLALSSVEQTLLKLETEYLISQTSVLLTFKTNISIL